MKRYLAVLVGFFLFGSAQLWAESAVVGPDGYPTIQDALCDGASAITVKSGSYPGFAIGLSVCENPPKKNIEIIGDGEVTLSGGVTNLLGYTYPQTIYLAGDAFPSSDPLVVKLVNLTITSSKDAYRIQVRNGRGSLTVEESVVTGGGSKVAIYLESPGAVRFVNSRIKGVTSYNSDSAVISGCRMEGSPDSGAYFNALDGAATIENSRFDNNGNSGLILFAVHGGVSLNNVSFTGNGGDGFSGVTYQVPVAFNQVSALKNGGRGIELEAGAALTYTGGEIAENSGGLNLSLGGFDVSLENLNVHDNTVEGGIWAGAGRFQLNGLNLSNNQRTSGSWGGGLTITGWSEAVLEDLTVVNNRTGGSGGGIHIAGGKSDATLGARNLLVQGNQAAASGGGIYLTVPDGTGSPFLGFDRIDVDGNIALSKTGRGGGFAAGSGGSPSARLGLANARFVGNLGYQGAAASLTGFCRVSMTGAEVTANGPYDPAYTGTTSALLLNRSARIGAATIAGNGTGYDLYLDPKVNSGEDVDATGVWWGTADPDAIEGRIYDKLDNAYSRNRVWIRPVLTSAPAQTARAPFPSVTCEGLPIPDEPQPELGTIRGRIMDRDLLVAIPHATVELYVEAPGLERFQRATAADEAGYYLFSGLDIQGVIDELYPPPLNSAQARVIYRVQVRNAWLPDVLLNSEWAGVTFFKDQAKGGIGVAPGEVAEVDFMMEPDLARGRKLWLIDVLSQESPNNYKAAEAGIFSYVTGLESGSMTKVQSQALARAVQAETAMMVGYGYASDLAEQFLESLGMLLENVISDLWESESGHEAAAERLKGVDFNKLYGSQGAKLKEQMLGGWKRQKAIFELKMTLLKFVLNEVYERIEAGLSEHRKPWAKVVKTAMDDLVVYLTSVGANGNLSNAAKGIVKGIVSATHPLIMDGGTASYCKTTVPFITDIIEPGLKNWSSADPAAFVRDMQKARDLLSEMAALGGNDLLHTVYRQEATKLQDTLKEKMELLANASTATGVGAGYGQALGNGAKVFGLTKYITNAMAIAHPLEALFSTFPRAVENAVRASFGQAATAGSLRAAASAPPARALAVETAAWTDSLAAAAEAAKAGCDAFKAALDQGLPAAIDRFTLSDPPGLLALLERLQAEEEAFLARAAAVKSGADTMQIYLDVVETVTQVDDDRIRLLGTLTDLLLGLAGGYSGENDPRYKALAATLGVLADHLKTLLTALETRADSLAAALASGELPPAVQVAGVTVRNAAGDSSITESPQSLTVEAVIRNIGSADVANPGAVLQLGNPEKFTVPAPGAEQTVGNLGVGEEATVTWTIDYRGDLTEGLLWFYVALLESGEPPAGFVGLSSWGSVSVAGAISNPGGDGIPLAYKRLCGLDETRNVASGDPDGDGLSNYEEYKLGTRADLADTDGDGVRDGAELGGLNGFFTDPLRADTDGDRANDGQDGAPLDPFSTAPAAADAASRMVLSPASITLSRSARSGTIAISEAAGKSLTWVAVAADPGLLTLSPQEGGAGKMTVAVPGTFSFAFYGSLRSRVYLFDVTGARRAPQTVEVILRGDEQHLPGDLNGDRRVDLADAVLGLQAAAGLSPRLPGYPDPLGADVNGDSTLGIGEAIQALQKASGLRP